MNASRQGTRAQDAQWVQGCVFNSSAMENKVKILEKYGEKKRSFWD